MKRITPLLILILLFLSCDKGSPTEDNHEYREFESCELSFKLYGVSQADPLTGMIEGDIFPDKVNSTDKAAVQMDRLWPDNKVPYFLDDDLGEDKKQQIRYRILNLESITNLNFIEYPDTESLQKDHKGGIHFRSPTGPFSGNGAHVGFQGGMQNITLVEASLDYVIDHEILHTIAYEHEIKRSDRDEHIIMLWENIPPNPNIRKQFDIEIAATLCGYFDKTSIMMYGSFTGGWWDAEETNRPVYTDMEGNLIPQPTEMSAGDITTANIIYPKNK